MEGLHNIIGTDLNHGRVKFSDSFKDDFWFFTRNNHPVPVHLPRAQGALV